MIYDLKFFPTNNAGELNEEFFNKWMNSFKEDFIKNGNSIDIFEDYSGKILNNAKGGKNGLPINDIACKYIESHYSTNLANGFIVSELNKRPIHRFTNGEDELTLSSQYENYSKILKANKYFKSALIYKKLSEIYAKEADEYRKYGEN